MIVFLKGLIDTKYLFKNIIIIILGLLLAIIMNITYNNIANKKDIQSNQQIYRTVLFKANTDIEQIINNNTDIIESCDISDEEYITITFKNVDYIDDFIEKYDEYFEEIERNILSASDKSFGNLSMTLLFLVNYIIIFLVIIFIIIMNINYLIHIEKDISLYSILGLPRWLCYLSILFLTSIICLIIDGLFFLSVTLIDNYFYCKVNDYLLLIPIVSLMLSVIVYSIYSKKKFDYMTIKEDFSS